jgi:hypothetical protein
MVLHLPEDDLEMEYEDCAVKDDEITMDHDGKTKKFNIETIGCERRLSHTG